jgi:hypothetical protein
MIYNMNNGILIPNDKILSLFDNSRTKDYIKKTEVIYYIEGTDIELTRNYNKVILPGAGFTARAHFNINVPEITPTYNSVLGLENTVSETPIVGAEKVYLFCVGTDGCGEQPSQVYNVDYGKWIQPGSLVPFRMPLLANDLDDTSREKYFGRRVIDSRAAYYFKSFETEPEWKQQYIDGTPIDSTVYDSTKTDEIESFVVLRLKITKQDCREFFINTTGINDAKVNTLSLCTGWAKVIDGKIYYQDIRPLTKLNIPNEALIDTTKGIDIVYHIYY